jgi:flagellar biosynthesis protein FliQ
MNQKKIFSGHRMVIDVNIVTLIAGLIIAALKPETTTKEGFISFAGVLVVMLIQSTIWGAFFSYQVVYLDEREDCIKIRNFKSLFREVTIPINAIESIEWRPWQKISNGVMDFLVITTANKTIPQKEVALFNDRHAAFWGKNRSGTFGEIKDFIHERNPKVKLKGLYSENVELRHHR